MRPDIDGRLRHLDDTEDHLLLYFSLEPPHDVLAEIEATARQLPFVAPVFRFMDEHDLAVADAEPFDGHSVKRIREFSGMHEPIIAHHIDGRHAQS